MGETEAVLRASEVATLLIHGPSRASGWEGYQHAFPSKKTSSRDLAVPEHQRGATRMILTELTAKQLTEQRRQELEPRRALYSSSAITVEPVEVKTETQRPILCDGCEKRAGAIGPMTFFCGRCQIVTRVTPKVGRVEFTLGQYAYTLEPNQFDLDKITEDAEASSKLDPLDPSEY
jgi:hypothetical protein